MSDVTSEPAANDSDIARWRQVVEQYLVRRRAHGAGHMMDKDARLKWFAENAMIGVDCD